MVKILVKEDIPEVVDIWNENSEYLTSDGKKHTIESFNGWFEGKYNINHEIYTFFRNNKIIGFCITKDESGISWVKMFALSIYNQNKGLGSDYLKKIHNLQKHPIVQCEVKENNFIALNFFIHNGYSKIDFDEEYKEYILQASTKN